jgi:thioredoxin-related protein
MKHEAMRIVQSVLAPGILAVALVGCGPTRWEMTLERGLTRAAKEQRPALVMFASAMSADCIAMDRDVFPDPQVQKAMETFVPVRLDFLMNRKLAEQLGVTTVPTFLVFRPDRSVAGMAEGKMDVARFGVFLIKYRYY